METCETIFTNYDQLYITSIYEQRLWTKQYTTPIDDYVVSVIPPFWISKVFCYTDNFNSKYWNIIRDVKNTLKRNSLMII